MFIEEMYLENWCQHASLRVPLRPGVNGIIGANGNGKSNFLDAIRLLFTGESINPGGREDNLKWGTKAGFVQGKVRIGDLSYEIKRNIHNGGCHMRWTEPDGTKHDLRKIGEVQARINELLGTTPATLLDAVFVPQGKIDGILFQKNTERLKEFQQAFGLAAAADAFRILSDEATAFQITPGLQDALNDAVTRYRSSVADLARIEQELQDVQARIAAQAPHEAVLQRRDRAQQHNAALRQADATLAAALAAETRLNAERDKAAAALAAAETALGGDDILLPGMRQKYAELTHLKANFDRYAVVAASRTTLQTELDGLQVITDPDVAALVAAETEANNAVQRIQGMLTGAVVRPQVPAEAEANAAFQAVTVEIQVRRGKGVQWSPELVALRDHARNLKQHLDHFATGKCPTCGQDVAGGPQEAQRRKAEYDEVCARGTAMEVAECAAEAAALDTLARRRDTLNEQLRGFRDSCTAFLNQQLLVTQGALVAARTAAAAGWNLLTRRKQLASQLQAYEAAMGAPVQAPSAAELADLGTRITAIENAVADTNALRQRAAIAANSAQNQTAAVQAAKEAKAALGTTLDAPSDQEVAAAQASIPVLLALRSAETKLRSDVAMTTATRDTRHQECERLQRQVATEAKHAAWVKLVRESRDVLHVGQLPRLIMQEYGKILNGQLDYYLEKFQAPFRVWLSDDLEFRASKNSAAEMDALRLSGAEKIIASVSFRMGMSDTFARQVGLLVLDEPSNYLDDANIQNLQMVLLELKKMSAHTGRQVLVVTHEDKLTTFFDHTIQIGTSTLDVAT